MEPRGNSKHIDKKMNLFRCTFYSLSCREGVMDHAYRYDGKCRKGKYKPRKHRKKNCSHNTRFPSLSPSPASY